MKSPKLLTLAATAAFITSASASVTMDWVTVGNAGNAADTTGYGAVGYAYQIGKYEVTNAQYGAFLNAKGASNSGAIYSSSMSSTGITQTGSSGNFSYSVTSGFENKPVVHVSWFDAARFANWMMNGQDSGDMETGAYTLNGATSGIITANIGAQVYLPSEDEWYKAAYYSAANTSYSLYPDGQNSITPEANNAYNTFIAGMLSGGGPVDVGSYSNSPSSFGTFDQGGNVWEWNDAVSGSSRGGRGGFAIQQPDGLLPSSRRQDVPPSIETSDLGFRLASAVPEPGSLVLTMLASGVVLLRRKR